ncbi:MAG: hypothetical protein AABX13_03340 [Nanoarchaeota archaeon]
MAIPYRREMPLSLEEKAEVLLAIDAGPKSKPEKFDRVTSGVPESAGEKESRYFNAFYSLVRAGLIEEVKTKHWETSSPWSEHESGGYTVYYRLTEKGVKAREEIGRGYKELAATLQKHLSL